VMHDGMPYGRIQGQGQGHSREVDRQSPTGLIFYSFFLLQGICVYFRRMPLYNVEILITEQPNDKMIHKHLQLLNSENCTHSLLS